MQSILASVLLCAAALVTAAAANNAAPAANNAATAMVVDAVPGTSSPSRARHLAAAAADGKCANAGELSPGGVPRIPEGKWSGLTSMHDPTHIVATADGYLFTFSSASSTSGSGCVIDQRFLRPASTAWEAAGPLFGGCARADAPAWWAGDRTAAPDAPALADADAPSVLYSAAPAYPGPDGALHNFVMYYSKYYQTGDAAATGDEEGAQACIGRATADWKGDGTDDPRALTWVDDGKPVLCSNSKLDPATGAPVARLYPTEAALCAAWGAAGCTFAIDPAVYTSADGRLWMAYGSGSILVVELDRATGGLIKAAQPYYTPALEAAGHYTIASVGADLFNEAPYVYRHAHNGVEYYYLFVNWFACCAREKSTYVIRVGRSTSPTGPFFDDQGIQMSQDDERTVSSPVEDGAMVPAGGGRLVLDVTMAGGGGRYIGPGHAGVLRYPTAPGTDANAPVGEAFTFHFYDKLECGAAKLGARPLTWDAAGWPVVGAEPWDPWAFHRGRGLVPPTPAPTPAVVVVAPTPTSAPTPQTPAPTGAPTGAPTATEAPTPVDSSSDDDTDDGGSTPSPTSSSTDWILPTAVGGGAAAWCLAAAVVGSCRRRQQQLLPPGRAEGGKKGGDGAVVRGVEAMV